MFRNILSKQILTRFSFQMLQRTIILSSNRFVVVVVVEIATAFFTLITFSFAVCTGMFTKRDCVR